MRRAEEWEKQRVPEPGAHTDRRPAPDIQEQRAPVTGGSGGRRNEPMALAS